jgi:hypothetical protein
MEQSIKNRSASKNSGENTSLYELERNKQRSVVQYKRDNKTNLLGNLFLYFRVHRICRS